MFDLFLFVEKKKKIKEKKKSMFSPLLFFSSFFFFLFSVLFLGDLQPTRGGEGERGAKQSFISSIVRWKKRKKEKKNKTKLTKTCGTY